MAGLVSHTHTISFCLLTSDDKTALEKVDINPTSPRQGVERQD